MKIIKKLDKERYIIIVENAEGESFEMEYGGADFYWNMLKYTENNKFVITKNEQVLYKQLQYLFRVIKKCSKENPYLNIFKDNTFTWTSEVAGLLEDNNKLLITENADNYVIHFWQNPNYYYNFGLGCNSCFVSFNLSGSICSKVAHAFSEVFLEYLNCEVDVPLTRKLRNDLIK